MPRSKPCCARAREAAGSSPNSPGATARPRPTCCSRPSPGSSARCSSTSPRQARAEQCLRRACGDERGDRPHQARDRADQAVASVRPAARRRHGRARAYRRGDREGDLGHSSGGRGNPRSGVASARERAPRSSFATSSISAPPTSTPPARSRTSPGSARRKWSRRFASSSSGSTP